MSYFVHSPAWEPFDGDQKILDAMLEEAEEISIP
jgi:hypothetical protein